VTIRRKATLKNFCVNVIGCGFAGIECALFLADHGINVHVFDCATGTNRYRCDCHNCEIYGETEENKTFARDLLRKELKILGSRLAEKEDFLRDGEKYSSCVADKLLEYGVARVKNHPKIEFFNICVSELNLEEINIIASGPHTSHGLLSFLKDLHGSMRMFESFSIFPIVQGIDESEFYVRGDELYLPLSYQEYISLCNLILSERKCLIKKNYPVKNDLCLIEEMARKEKDGLKNNIMRPIFIENLEEKPYACLKLVRLARGFEIEGFSSSFPPESQYKIINSIRGLRNAVILQAGKAIENHYINAPFVINEFGQSIKHPNIFYAGNISGVYGHIESMASGLSVAYNVINLMQNREMKAFPKESAIGALNDKVISSTIIRNRPVIADYDIIKTTINFNSFEDKKKYLFENCEKSLNKFKEEIFNGKHV
jgi:methylenetetrahydrofolate--tRNA-(uracil-5-)-methyltransferase